MEDYRVCSSAWLNINVSECSGVLESSFCLFFLEKTEDFSVAWIQHSVEKAGSCMPVVGLRCWSLFTSDRAATSLLHMMKELALTSSGILKALKLWLC